MKKRLFRIAVITFAVVVIPIAVFHMIRLVTKPASISREEAIKLPLEEGQKLYASAYDEVYEWGACRICLDGGNAEWVSGCTNLVIENDFFVRHFQDLGKTYVIIVHFTGNENSDGFRIVVVDEWYVLEE